MSCARLPHRGRKGLPFAAQAAAKNGFDFNEDYPLIVASFAAAYGLRIRSPDTHVPWPEFIALLAGLPAGTSLAQMIAIRLAGDKEAENLGAAARQAREDWQLRLAERTEKAHGAASQRLEQVFRSLFGKPAKL